MSAIRKYPFIQSVIDSLTLEQIQTLNSLLNSPTANIKYSLDNLPADAGVYPCDFYLKDGKIYSSILVKNSTYTVVIAYHRFQDLLMFNIVNGTLIKVNEYLDINELRRIVGDELVEAGVIGSGSATEGQVLTADGHGGVSWEDAGAGVEANSGDITTNPLRDLTVGSDEYNVLAADDILANQYDDTATYAVGDYCVKENLLYRCNTTISTAEDWTAAHWTAIKVMNVVADKPTTESVTISSWTADGNIAPFTYKATVTAVTSIGANNTVELINDDAVLFATYGFNIGSVSGQSVTIYALSEPASSVTLKIGIGGYVISASEANLQSQIGTLSDLTTTAKNNLVAAINEVAAGSGGGGGSVSLYQHVVEIGAGTINYLKAGILVIYNSSNSPITSYSDLESICSNGELLPVYNCIGTITNSNNMCIALYLKKQEGQTGRFECVVYDTVSAQKRTGSGDWLNISISSDTVTQIL